MTEAFDADPLQVEYISFGSYNTNLVKFYFNCSFSFATPDAVYDTTDHPLLAKDVPSTIDLRNCMCATFFIWAKTASHPASQINWTCFLIFFFFCYSLCLRVWFLSQYSRTVLVTKCGYYSISDYDYRHYIKISDIKDAQPDGYIVRLIFYIQGARDGNVLLATSDHPNFERDFVYEFGK